MRARRHHRRRDARQRVHGVRKNDHVDSGDPERVVEMRYDFQRLMTRRYCDAIEELTGREVVAFLSQAHVDPDITIEVFFVDRPLDGFGSVEIVTPADTWTPADEPDERSS